MIRKLYGRQEGRYVDLIRQFPLRRIRSDVELHAAIRVIDSLIDQKRRTPAEEDYLDMISDIVEAYEDEHVIFDEGTDGELLTFLMESNALTQAQLAKNVGIATSTVCEVISGKRQLTRKQIEKLAAYFKVSPAVFHTTPA